MAGKLSAGPSPLSSSRVDLVIGEAEDVIVDAEACDREVKLWRIWKGREIQTQEFLTTRVDEQVPECLQQRLHGGESRSGKEIVSS